MEKIITYSLLQGQEHSDEFYANLAKFTDQILDEAEPFLENRALDFQKYIANSRIENTRTTDEYTLELMIAGVLWNNYISYARKTKFISKVLLKRLYDIRKLNPSVKNSVDMVRGVLAYELLNNMADHLSVDYSETAFKSLIEWLQATGEFTEEVLRLKHWLTYFQTVAVNDAPAILQAAAEFAHHFSSKGRIQLGKYLPNLHQFRAEKLKEYRHKEDYFFAARRDNEYYLNMFGAEVLNRSMRADFEATTDKAILLPTCMRNQPYDGCKAVWDGKELVCKSCFSKCNIGRVAKVMRHQDVETYLIPHSSDFSRFLQKWKGNKETGLVGVACILNLLKGGYEMKRLGIASQCVFLDYCGCKKHWDEDGEVTNLNLNRLEHLVRSNVSVHQFV